MEHIKISLPRQPRNILIVKKLYTVEVEYAIQDGDLDYYREVQKETGRSIDEIMEENIKELGVEGKGLNCDLEIWKMEFTPIKD
jgi:hypothetical protein